MTGATIDHLISLTILIAALLIAMMTFNGLFASAIDYDRNRQVANKAIDITNTICLSPGSPPDWGQNASSPIRGFGLQDPRVGGYALSPYSIMRLTTSNSSGYSQIVEYPPDSGIFYNNISTNYGHAILTPLGDCINYTTAAELLGVNGTYGFSVDITPTLKVDIEPVDEASNLTINVAVSGSGLPLSDATLRYYLFHTKTLEAEDSYPFVDVYSGVTPTESSGSVDITFPISGNDNLVYSFTVYVSLGGLNGVGTYIRSTIPDNDFIVPLIDDYNTGELLLAHGWDNPGPYGSAAVFYNASFFILTSDFQLQEFDLNCSGHLTYGEGFSFVETQIPASEVGLLLVSYKARDDLGCLIVPWGVGALGVSASFSAGLGSSADYDFVATELRQVKIDGISYQVKVSAWSLGD